ncbi:oxidoreductase, zinc-binding dehydrogenase family protein [Pseudovibrio sp. FO-BEG1]|uniref:NADPH:quinone oxidoreductase family protein n=1 Tax=Pseudovibrio sp. (strain FO-BEG1) TaxID=911045 RepID=UPI000238C0D6|nr:NADPH:quinone oxidoreductase family protein [Pseudovibrio sp. FO-BEG1]AEV36545.1 oxidoreductase, zinc-binding dehydrogenase family protein [Pseudovibrio sp. FO-BEG1]
MRAVVCSEYGPPEALRVEDVERKEPKKGQVRIVVEAAGVNFPDTLVIAGKYQIKPPMPFVPGGEVAGRIEVVGEGVTDFAPGDPVMALLLQQGGYAEEVVVDASAVMKRPETMSAQVAAGFTMTYGTSMHALKQRAQLQPGETLLVLGAGGGVGLTAVEIGKIMGAKVIAAASSAEKLEAARKAGADELINYSTQDLRERLKEIVGKAGVDVVYDPVGGDLFEQALRSTAWNGRALVVGFAAGDIPSIPTNLPLLKGCSVMGVFWGAFRMREPSNDQNNFSELFKWLQEGKLKPTVSKSYSLEEAPQALRDLMERRVVGKVVLETGRT